MNCDELYIATVAENARLRSVIYAIYGITVDSYDVTDRLSDIQKCCTQGLNPPVIPADPIEDECES